MLRTRSVLSRHPSLVGTTSHGPASPSRVRRPRSGRDEPEKEIPSDSKRARSGAAEAAPRQGIRDDLHPAIRRGRRGCRARLRARVSDAVDREHGKLVKVEAWGRRKLAYPVGKQRRGVYVYLKYVGGGGLVAEVERNLKLQDSVIKFMTVQSRDEVDIDALQIDPEETTLGKFELPPEDEKEESREKQLGLVDLGLGGPAGPSPDGSTSMPRSARKPKGTAPRLSPPLPRPKRKRRAGSPTISAMMDDDRDITRGPDLNAEITAAGWKEARLQVPRRQGGGHRLQGFEALNAIPSPSAGRSSTSPHQWQLRASPAQGPARGQACAQHRAAAVLRSRTESEFAVEFAVSWGSPATSPSPSGIYDALPPFEAILQHDVEKLGKSGELVRVRPGFARNFLLPRQLAVPATDAAVHRIEHERAVAMAKAEKAKKKRRASSPRSSADWPSRSSRRPATTGASSGSVTVKDIGSAVAAAGIEIDRKKIHLAEAIKATRYLRG